MRPLIKMNDAPLERGGGCLGAIAHVQLAKQAVKIGFDGSFGNLKVPCDLLVTSARDNALQDLELAPCHRRRSK